MESIADGQVFAGQDKKLGRVKAKLVVFAPRTGSLKHVARARFASLYKSEWAVAAAGLFDVG